MTTYIPSLSDVRKMTGRGNVVPVYREVRADLETPVSAFLKVARGPYSFLLESVEGGERQGRYSFIGTEPYRVYAGLHEAGDPLDVVQAEMARFDAVDVPGLPRFHGGAVGYLGYEAVTHFEPRVPLDAKHPMLASLKKIVDQLDPMRRFVPTSPLGPSVHTRSGDWFYW